MSVFMLGFENGFMSVQGADWLKCDCVNFLMALPCEESNQAWARSVQLLSSLRTWGLQGEVGKGQEGIGVLQRFQHEKSLADMELVL